MKSHQIHIRKVFDKLGIQNANRLHNTTVAIYRHFFTTSPNPISFPPTDEMNKAICWYLTCDRYWEDASAQRPFPWALCKLNELFTPYSPF